MERRLVDLPSIEVEVNRHGPILNVDGSVGGSEVNVAITVARNPDNIENIASQILSINGRSPARVVEYEGLYAVIAAHGNFEIFDHPMPSTSRDFGSQSHYLGQTLNREMVIQAQGPGKISSEHSHDGPEEYHHVAGELLVHCENGPRTLSSINPRVNVEENVFHRVKGLGSTPAISLIICRFTKHIYSR